MKHFITFIICIAFYLNVNAQVFAVIKDKDGYVNVRKDKGIQSAIVGKLSSGSIVSYDEDDLKSDWINIYHQNANYPTEGYVHKSRIYPLANFKRIKNIKVLRNKYRVYSDTLAVTVSEIPFVSKQHQISIVKTQPDGSQELRKIDGKFFWGTDGELPKKALSIKVIQNSRDIVIPVSAYNDLYEPSLRTLTVYLGESNTIYIKMDNSDGAGSYTVIWTFKNGKYIKRYIDNINA